MSLLSLDEFSFWPWTFEWLCIWQLFCFSVSVSVSALNRPEKKKRKKLMKDSLCLAAMIRRFSREKEEIRKKNPATVVKLVRAPPNNTPTAAAVAPGNDLTMADLTSDPVVMMTLLGGATENDVLQELMGDLDFGLLDSPGPSSPGQSENGVAAGQKAGAAGRVQKTGLVPPPPLPNSLPAPLLKRIEDLRTVSAHLYIHVTDLLLAPAKLIHEPCLITFTCENFRNRRLMEWRTFEMQFEKLSCFFIRLHVYIV